MICVVLTNWNYSATLSRTYFNSFETALTIVAYYLWLVRHRLSWADLGSRALVVVAFSSRPTSIMLWALIWPY